MNADIAWLDDPEVFRVNRLDAHSDHGFFKNKEEMAVGESSLVQSLNGTWKFCYSENASSRPVNFYEEGFDDSNFDEIKVPCHIEMAGYDKIHYINTMYPWEGHFYRRPAHSLERSIKWQGFAAQYQTRFPAHWKTGNMKNFYLRMGAGSLRYKLCFPGLLDARCPRGSVRGIPPDFGCGYRFMTEHLLDCTQVCTPFEQMSRERMAQGVGRYGFLYPGSCG